jgi:hypothetical protein
VRAAWHLTVLPLAGLLAGLLMLLLVCGTGASGHG